MQSSLACYTTLALILINGDESIIYTGCGREMSDYKNNKNSVWSNYCFYSRPFSLPHTVSVHHSKRVSYCLYSTAWQHVVCEAHVPHL